MHSWHCYLCLQECLIEMLQEMFGEDSVPKIFKGEKLYVTVDGKKANIDLLNLVSTELMYVLLSTCVYLLFTNIITCYRKSVAKRMRYSSRLCRQLSPNCTSPLRHLELNEGWWHFHCHFVISHFQQVCNHEFQIFLRTNWNSRFSGGDPEDEDILGCDTVQSGRYVLTFQRNLLPASPAHWWR